tara:strand:+ start:14211 stop:14774 length:564 start_codon:yes stop_codon:yes gene_type:complete
VEILKYILIAVVTTIIAYLTLCTFTPSQVIISQTEIINKPINEVFPKLSRVDEWPQWHPWFRQIKKAEHKIEQKDEIGGSFISWNGPEDKGGKIEVTGYTQNQSVQMDITYEKDNFQKVNKSEFLVESNGGRTRVSWILVGTEYPFLLKPTTIILKSVFTKNFEVGLKNLKAVCEGRPLPAKSRLEE